MEARNGLQCRVKSKTMVHYVISSTGELAWNVAINSLLRHNLREDYVSQSHRDNRDATLLSATLREELIVNTNAAYRTACGGGYLDSFLLVCLLRNVLLRPTDHIHIWHGSAQLSFDGTSQIWTWYSFNKLCFDNSEMLKKLQNGGN